MFDWMRRPAAVKLTEEDAIKELGSILREADAWIHAPPLQEGLRRAVLLRQLVSENPEGAPA